MTNCRFRSVSVCPIRLAIVALGAMLILTPVARAQTALPPPESAGFEHVVVVMMENRSFDHFFGWLPGANGQQAGLLFKDSAGTQHPTHYLPPDYQGCPFSTQATPTQMAACNTTMALRMAGCLMAPIQAAQIRSRQMTFSQSVITGRATFLFLERPGQPSPFVTTISPE